MVLLFFFFKKNLWVSVVFQVVSECFLTASKNPPCPMPVGFLLMGVSSTFERKIHPPFPLGGCGYRKT